MNITVRNQSPQSEKIIQIFIKSPNGTVWFQDYQSTVEPRQFKALIFGNNETPSTFQWEATQIYGITVWTKTGWAIGEAFASPGRPVTAFRVESIDFIVQDDSTPIHDLIRLQIRNYGTTTVMITDVKSKGDFTISDYTSTSPGTETTFSDTDPDVTDSPDSQVVIYPRDLGFFWFDLPVGRDWMPSEVYEITITTDKGFTTSQFFTSPDNHTISFFVSVSNTTLTTGQTLDVIVTSLNGYAPVTLSNSINLAGLSATTIAGRGFTPTTPLETIGTTLTWSATVTLSRLTAGPTSLTLFSTSGSVGPTTGILTVSTGGEVTLTLSSGITGATTGTLTLSTTPTSPLSASLSGTLAGSPGPNQATSVSIDGALVTVIFTGAVTGTLTGIITEGTSGAVTVTSGGVSKSTPTITIS